MSTREQVPSDVGAQSGEYVRQLMAHRRKIYWYIFALLHDAHDAEEVFQQTALILWQKFAEFEPGTSFVAWACRIALYEVLHLRRTRRREIPCFTDVFLEEVAPDLLAVIDTERSDYLQERLSECLAKLKERDRDLVQRRYRPGATTRRVAAEVSRSPDAVYKALNRIHQALFECITRDAIPAGGQRG